MRLIDADELKIDYGFTYSDITPTHEEMYALIDRQKTVESARKKGRWIYYPKASGSTSTAVYFYPVCSECGREHPIANYCPNCGAKMEGEQDE